MKKLLTFFTLAVVMLLVFAACGNDAASETGITEPATTATDQTSATTAAEQSAATPDNQPQAEQGDTLRRIRENDEWIADMISGWAAELDMTVDEIFDYVRAATTLEYAFDYGIEGGMDVSELAARVGGTSVGFMGVIHMAYDSTRSVDNVHRWAAELNMTAFELVDYVFGGNDSLHLADTLGLEWGEFQNVLAGASNALTNERVRAHSNAESVDIVRGWANEFDMTLDEFIDYYNSVDFMFIPTAERLGIELTAFSVLMRGAIQFLSSNE